MNEKIIGTGELRDRMLASKPTGKSLWSVQSTQLELFNKAPMAKQEMKQVTMLKVKSNFAKNRTVSIGDFHIAFDSNGETLVPSHYKEALDREMIVRPGRYCWVEERLPEVTVVEENLDSQISPEEETFSLEQEIEEVLEAEPEPTPEKAPNKKIVAKATKKK